jgi:hypothetical protein
MNDVAGVKTGVANATPFDEAAFRERLAELNPWLREPESEHEALRRAATHARFGEGRDAWNAWGQAMLAEKAGLEAAGEWQVESWGAGKNDATRTWMGAAEAPFSSAKGSHIFQSDVDLSGFVFPGTAGFNGATFSGHAGFTEATFSGDAGFIQARFEGYTAFDNAHFKRSAQFTAMQGKSYFSLRGVTFDMVPDFEQAHFAEAPRLDVSEFPRAGVRPKVGKGKDDEKQEPLGNEETARWRSLKRLAAQGHDHEREQLFFARELQSLRGSTDFMLGRNFGRWWFGRLYEWFSDFGRSMLRPLLWWSVFTVLFAGLYLAAHFEQVETDRRAGNQNQITENHPRYTGTVDWLSAGGAAALKRIGAWPKAIDDLALVGDTARGAPRCITSGSDGTTPVSAAFAASLRKGLLFAGLGDTDKASQDFACLYGLDRKLMAEVQGSQLVRRVPDAVAYAGLAQTLISAVLLFLFLLAMRNQFRIR